MKETIWGLDLGTTSIGFAIVEQDAQTQNGEIKKMGVRIFPEGVTEKELEPRNRRRREKRLMRRQLRRRKLRRIELTKRMAEVGLMPKFESIEWKELMNTDPYLIRSDAFERKLEEFELGRDYASADAATEEEMLELEVKSIAGRQSKMWVQVTQVLTTDQAMRNMAIIDK